MNITSGEIIIVDPCYENASYEIKAIAQNGFWDTNAQIIDGRVASLEATFSQSVKGVGRLKLLGCCDVDSGQLGFFCKSQYKKK